jgi:hypothetical protein
VIVVRVLLYRVRGVDQTVEQERQTAVSRTHRVTWIAHWTLNSGIREVAKIALPRHLYRACCID